MKPARSRTSIVQERFEITELKLPQVRQCAAGAIVEAVRHGRIARKVFASIDAAEQTEVGERLHCHRQSFRGLSVELGLFPSRQKIFAIAVHLGGDGDCLDRAERVGKTQARGHALNGYFRRGFDRLRIENRDRFGSGRVDKYRSDTEAGKCPCHCLDAELISGNRLHKSGPRGRAFPFRAGEAGCSE